jgi:23S rRNA (guanosine2251-2'-O)-methyltransferase
MTPQTPQVPDVQPQSPQTQWVLGKHGVHTALSQTPKRVAKVLISQSAQPNKRIQAILDLAKQHGIVVQPVPRQKLDQLTTDPDLPHQGIAAQVAAQAFWALEALLEAIPNQLPKTRKFPLLIALDDIQDPRNLGAILRVADGAGASGVLLPKRHSAGWGPGVGVTSAGADQTVPVAMVGNLSNALKTCQEAGFWVVGSVMGTAAKPYTALKYDHPTVLLMGNEAKGIGPALQKACDFQVTIPMHGQVPSLNVATATAILAFAITQHHV